MALSCIMAEIEVLIENHDFLIPLAFDAPCPNIAIMFGKKKIVEWCGYATVKKKLKICTTDLTEYWRVRDRLTDRNLATA